MLTVLSCPLGSECEKVVNNELHTCRWYIEISGTNPQDGALIRKKDCAMTWLPIFILESNKLLTQNLEANVLQKEEVVQRQNLALNTLSKLIPVMTNE
jgi:hypothetical protein